MDNNNTPNENEVNTLPYIKYTDNLFSTTLDNVININITSLNISHIILIGKYTSKEQITYSEHDIHNSSKFVYLHFDYDETNPTENFLFGFKTFTTFINDNPTLLISDSTTCALTPAVLVAYFLSQGTQLQHAINKVRNSSLILPEHMTLLEKYEKHLHITQPEYYYKCGKCRNTLFNDTSLIFLHEFKPKTNYSYKRHKKSTVQTTECTSYFLNEAIDDENEKQMKVDNGGKILCKKCNNKLGEYLPKGTQCSCGSWVVPAVQIIKSKVDKIKYIYS
jgi:dual specificity phosphatase 12